MPQPSGTPAQGSAVLRSDSSRVEREFFDAELGSIGDFNPFTPQAWAILAKRFAELVPGIAHESLLDVGCGTGMSRQIYAPRVRGYFGADLSLVAVGHASRALRGTERRWLQADACSLPFPSGRFQVVAFSSVLHHIPAFGRAVGEAVRVLQPGGWAFAFDPNLLHPAMALFRWPRSPLYNPQGVSPNERPLLPSELRRAFGDAGLVNLRQRCQAGLTYRSVAPGALRRALPLYNWADRVFARSGLGRWLGTFVLTAGQKPTLLGESPHGS